MAYKLIQPKKHKEEDLFSMESEEKEKQKEKYEAEQEKIAEINKDLESENSPMRVKDKFTLEIESNGQKHKINRNDLTEYQRKYGLEDGTSDDRAFTTFRSLGTIHGNYELLDKIYDDSHRLFNDIDGESSYKTTYIED
jgi:hypothetical protein